MDRVSSSEGCRGEHKDAHRATFEDAYQRYEFAELVRLALAAGAWLVKMRARLERRRPIIPSAPLPGEMNPPSEVA
jgi:hypothetical protein